MVTLPGLFDCHVHFRTPGQEYKEDWVTGSAAALAGGVVGVVDMPSNVPPVLTQADLLNKQRLIEKVNPGIAYRLPLGVTDKSLQDTLAAQEQACGIKVFLQPHSTGMFVRNDATLHTLYQNATKPIMIHDHTGVDRIMPFVRQYKKLTYFCHISTQTEVEKIAQAKREGLPVYAEVTLHHLWLDETTKTQPVNPPLRTAADRAALWEGVRAGVIDTIATDHAPHLISESNLPGFPSIEFFVPLLFTGLAQNKLSIDDIIRCCVTNPTKLFGFTSQKKIDLDPDWKWTISQADIKSKCGWSPYLNMPVQGKVLRVY
ncbi:MAG: amidohydrolase family protein [Patescibacteria group bacterium]